MSNIKWGAVNVNKSIIEASPNIVTIGDEVTLTVKLLDSYNNLVPLSGQKVNIFKAGGDADSKINDVKYENSEYTVTTRSSKSGTDTFGFEVNEQPAKSTVNVVYEKLIDVNKSTITAKPTTVKVGKDVILTVKLFDSNGAPIVVEKVNIFKTDGDADSKINDVKHLGNGEYKMKTTSTKSDTDTFGFKVGSQNGTSTVNVEYEPGVFDVNKSIITADSPTVTVDKDVTLKVKLLDRYENFVPLAGQKVSILKTKGDAESEINDVNDIGNGEYTMMTKSIKSGTDTFGFKVNGKPSKSTTNVEYKPGAVFKETSEVLVIVPEDEPKVLLYKNETATIKIKLRDKFDNPIELQSVTGIATGRALDVSKCRRPDDGSDYDYQCVTPTTQEGRYGKTTFRVEGITSGMIENDVNVEFIYDHVKWVYNRTQYPNLIFTYVSSRGEGPFPVLGWWYSSSGWHDTNTKITNTGVVIVCGNCATYDYRNMQYLRFDYKITGQSQSCRFGIGECDVY